MSDFKKFDKISAEKEGDDELASELELCRAALRRFEGLAFILILTYVVYPFGTASNKPKEQFRSMALDLLDKIIAKFTPEGLEKTGRELEALGLEIFKYRDQEVI